MEELIIYEDEFDILEYQPQRYLHNSNILWAHLLDLWPIIKIVLLTRLSHLLVDLISPINFKWKSDLRHFITAIFGWVQLLNYVSTMNLDGSPSILLCSIIIIYLCHCKRSSTLETTPIFSSVILIFAPIVLNEYLIYFHRIHNLVHLRSVYMTLSMKMTSRLFNKKKKTTSSWNSSYLLHPASIIFGPWHMDESEKVELSRSSTISIFLKQLINASVTFVKSLGFLLISASVIDIINEQFEYSLGDLFVTKWLSVYFRAQEFRFSHYFVCYLSLSFLTLWSDGANNGNQEICRVFKIEWPRSLVQVVVYWNIPMHIWLKNYIFNPIKLQSSNAFLPIIITYLVSSTLHGFKFHIWAVLLSLGLLTWCEYRIRLRLSKRFSACVLAKTCSYSKVTGRCSYGHMRTAQNSNLVKLINFIFRILAMANLAYLGYVFQGNTDQASYNEALESWNELYFYSHVILLLKYMLTI